MPDFTLSGYKSAAVTIPWASGQSLAGLTDGETTDLSDAIDNSTTLYMFCDVEIALASASFTGSAAIEVYLVPSVDGTNYMDFDGNTTTPGDVNNGYRVGIIPLRGTVGAARGSLARVPFYNGLQKFAFRSQANVTLAGSGNTAKYRPHQTQG